MGSLTSAQQEGAEQIATKMDLLLANPGYSGGWQAVAGNAALGAPVEVQPRGRPQ